MSESTASGLLTSRLLTLVGSPPIAAMNGPTFTPVVGENWLAEFDMSAGTSELSINIAGAQRKDGIYQVNVMTPVGKYRYDGLDLAESVKALFRGYNESGLTVLSVEIGKQQNGDNWLMTPVSVNYVVLF